MSTAKEIVTALGCPTPSCPCHRSQRQGYGLVHCPAHEDRNPSLNVTEVGGTVLLRCHAGCSQEDVIAALVERGIWSTPRENDPLRRSSAASVPLEWPIKNTTGETVAIHVRRDTPEGKKLIWKLPDGRWGLNGLKVADLPLYGIDRLNGAKGVILTEGEKAAKALIDQGLPALGTVTGAASIPGDEALKPLLGQKVYLWPDADQVGREHMNRVAERLHALGHDAVYVIDWKQAPDKGDAADFIAFGHDDDDVRELSKAAQKAFYPSRVEGRSETKFVWYTAREIAAQTPEEVPWIARPWVAAGSITEVDAKIKVGKSAWITHVARAVLDGAPFMGESTIQSPVIYLTEQPQGSFRQALKVARLLDRDDFHVLFFHDVAGQTWADVVNAAVAKCQATGARLLVVDTLGQFAGLRGDTENNAGTAMEAMEPLQVAAASGLGVIVARHERKSGGEVGESARGSSAFGGTVDTVLSIRRANGNTRPTVRVIQSIGRFEETPETLVIELTPTGYVALGDEVAVAVAEARTAILDHAPVVEASALTKPELLDQLDGISSTTAQRVLTELVNDKVLKKIGAGKRGDPFKYWRPLGGIGPEKISDQPQPPRSETIDTQLSRHGDHDPIVSDRTPTPRGTKETTETETRDPEVIEVVRGWPDELLDERHNGFSIRHWLTQYERDEPKAKTFALDRIRTILGSEAS